MSMQFYYNNAKNYIDKYDIKFLKREQFRADIKIVVIGDNSTNKTQFANRWTKNIFNETYKATIVSEFGFKIYEYDGRLYRIQLWDLAGQDRNAALIEIFGKYADGAVIMSEYIIRSRRSAYTACTCFASNPAYRGCLPSVSRCPGRGA